MRTELWESDLAIRHIVRVTCAGPSLEDFVDASDRTDPVGRVETSGLRLGQATPCAGRAQTGARA